MSQYYAYKDSKTLESLRALENSVKQLTAEFQGANAFNFSHELELAAYLMVWTREAHATSQESGKSTICLARLEWPCVKGRSIDLVLWKPGTEKKARSNWGTPRGRLAKTLPLLAAVQVKRGGGRVTPWSSTKKDIDDLEAVYASEHLGKPVLYFLQWADESLLEDKGDRDTYREVQSNLANWCNVAPQWRRVLVASRDNVGFAYPRGAWLVDPLPPGAKELI